MWEYTDKVRDHFFNPRNVGEIEDADGVGEVGSLACGDALKLTFKLDKDGRIADAKFKTFGCASAIATSSVLTELIKGKTLEEADEGDQQGHRRLPRRPAGAEDALLGHGQRGPGGRHRQLPQAEGTKKHELEGNVVCTCFGVTEKEIERVIRENNLTTVEQVTNYCKAGGGCGGCKGEIEKIIERVQGEKAKEQELPPPRKDKHLTNIQKIQLIQQTINEQIRPALRAHGGNIELIDVDGRQGGHRLSRHVCPMQGQRCTP